MSLARTTNDTSKHPHAGSESVPTGNGAQAADVEWKFKLYGVIQAFRQGRMPDNAQIDKALSYLRDEEPVDVHKLSRDGKALIRDFHDIFETARLIFKEKNKDELFQNFVWHTRDIDVEAEVAKAGTPGDTSEGDHTRLTEDGRLAVRHLRTLVSLILTNSEVRKLLSDFSVIGRDLLTKAATKAAEAIRPGEEAISQVDKPAPNDEFVTKEGRKTGTGETPTLDVDIPPADVHVEQHLKADEPVVKTSQGEEANGGEAVDKTVQSDTEAGKAASEQISQTTHSAQDMTETPQAVAGPSERISEVKKRDLKGRLKDVTDGVKDIFTERSPQGQKTHAEELLEKGKHFLTDEYFPAERRDQFIYRGKKVIVECQKHDGYQDAIKWFLSVAEQYVELGEDATEKGKETADNIFNDPALQRAVSELRELLERFADHKSMHLIFDSIGALNDDASRDEAFRAWLRRLNHFIRKLLLETGYVLGEDCSREGKEIRESGRKFWDQKYRAHFDNVFDSIGDWFSAIGTDALNMRFGEDWARLTRDLLFDSDGSLKFKSALWSDIRTVIVPTLVDKIGYLPIPRIEYSDDALDLVLENLTLQGRNLLPNIVTVVAHNYLKFSPYDSASDEHHHEFTFTFGQIQADMRDVAFYFRKKTGFPKVMDSGMADVVIGGPGLTAVVHLVSAGKDRSSVFKVKGVNVKIQSLKFSIRDSKHDLLYKTLKPLATGLVKRQIKKAIAGAIRTGMEYVDGQLVSVRDRMEEARSSDEANRTQLLEELFKRHKDQHTTVRPSESKSHFKLVSSKRASVIDTGHPSGWVSRISESELKAATGKDWRSEAFTIA